VRGLAQIRTCSVTFSDSNLTFKHIKNSCVEYTPSVLCWGCFRILSRTAVLVSIPIVILGKFSSDLFLLSAFSSPGATQQ